MKEHLLFVCSGAKDRSPTAVGLFNRSNRYSAKSAGTHVNATKRINQKLIGWADIIFVMSEGTNRHFTYLRTNFKTAGKPIYDLHVRDMYFKNDPRLRALLKQRISKIIDL